MSKVYMCDLDSIGNEHVSQCKNTSVNVTIHLKEDIFFHQTCVTEIDEIISSNQTWHNMKQGVVYGICGATARQWPVY